MDKVSQNLQQPTPEASTAPETAPSVDSEKAPDLVELSKLRQEYGKSRNGLISSQRMLCTAMNVQNKNVVNLGSPEYQKIQQRMQSGESIDDIVNKSAENVRGVHETTLDKELDFREAEAKLLRSEVGSPVNDEAIMRTVESLEKHHAMRLDNPALEEVNRRKQAGESLTEIKQKAQNAIAKRERAMNMLKIAEGMKTPGKRVPLDNEARKIIKQRLDKGETLDQIIEKTRANIEGYQEVDRKKAELGQTLERLKDLKQRIRNLREANPKAQGAEDQQEISRIRQMLQRLSRKERDEAPAQPEKKPATTAESVAELLMENRQEFFTRLNTLQQEIIARDMEAKRQAGEINPYYPLDAQVPIPRMCGYSAPAITEAMRTVLGDENVRTVYGHKVKGKLEDRESMDVRPPYHYWTEVNVNGQKFIIDATQGQFDPQYEGQVIFAPAEDLEKYGLLEYNSGDKGGTEMDENTAKALQENNGNLPVADHLDDNLKYQYGSLVGSLRIPARQKFSQNN